MVALAVRPLPAAYGQRPTPPNLVLPQLRTQASIGLIATRAVRHFHRLEEFSYTFRRSVRTTAEPEVVPSRMLQRNQRREESQSPAPMVVRAPQAGPQPPAQKPMEEPRWREPQALPCAAPPAINIDSLTSQVMDQIDRRVIAWRERMGKF
jgi:hypothetical protein